MLSLVSSGKWTIPASISQTIYLTGIFDGVGANFGPFSRMERSAEESGFFDKLTTQLFLLTEVEWWVSFSLLRFESFFACLASIVVWTDRDLCFKNCDNVDKMSSVTKLDNRCLDPSKIACEDRILL